MYKFGGSWVALHGKGEARITHGSDELYLKLIWWIPVPQVTERRCTLQRFRRLLLVHAPFGIVMVQVVHPQ